MAKSKILKNLDSFLADAARNHPVASTALTFGSIGAGGAALAGLIRDLNTAIQDREKKKKLDKNEIGPDTIVLRIPKKNKKMAEDASQADPEVSEALKSSHDKIVSRQTAVSKETPVGSYATAGSQRDVHGKFTDSGEKCAGAPDGVLTRTGKILGGIGGLSAGYLLMAKLHEKLEQDRLKKQIAAAQQEYLDLVDGSSKHASVGSVFLCDDPVYGTHSEKQAGVIKDIANIPNHAKNIGSSALATYILMALGAGYVTNRVLHSKFDEEENDEEPPRTSRILFKSSSASAPTKIDPGVALATIGVMIDCIRSSHDPMSKQAADYSFIDKITKTPEGKQWLIDVYAKSRGLKRDVNPGDLPGLSPMDKLKYARTLTGLRRHPGRHMEGVRGRVMDLVRNDPDTWLSMLKERRNRDLVRHVASDTLSRGLSSGEFGQLASLPGVRHAIQGARSLYGMTPMGQSASVNDFARGLGQAKTAQSLSDIPAMLSRSKVLSDKTNFDLDKKLDMILENLPVKRKKKKSQPGNLELSYEKGDSDAEDFVLENGDQIARIVAAMDSKKST